MSSMIMTKAELLKLVHDEYDKVSAGNGFFNDELDAPILFSAREELQKWRDYVLFDLITKGEFVEQLDKYWKVVYIVTLENFEAEIENRWWQQNKQSVSEEFEDRIGQDAVILNRYAERDYVISKWLDWQYADNQIRTWEFIWIEEIINTKGEDELWTV